MQWMRTHMVMSVRNAMQLEQFECGKFDLRAKHSCAYQTPSPSILSTAVNAVVGAVVAAGVCTVTHLLT